MQLQKKLTLPYTQESLYTLIVDIEKYPTFISGCSAAKILERTSEFLRAELTVGYGPFKETFISKVYITPFDSIKAVGEAGPFHSLKVVWKFQALSPEETEVDFFLEVQFKSKILETIAGKMINRINISTLKNY
jgi:coenzyme Q-binding protein COQ10